jgi:DNA polymerase III subunit delta
VYSPVLGAELREDSLLAGYFFYGEETYLADQFVDQVREIMAASAGEDFHVDRFDLGEARWPELIDTARTVPFLFQAWRLLVVRIPERRPGAEKGGWRKAEGEPEDGKGARFLSEADQKTIRAYFADPPTRTILVVIMPGKVRKNDTAVRFFSSLGGDAVLVKEVKPLYARELRPWLDRKAQSVGKSLTEAAKDRLIEVVGSDLRLLTNEVEKLAVFVGDKRGIDEDDVNQATGWLRSYEAYELDDVLTTADFSRAAGILDRLFAENERPEMIVARLATFFRNILTAQAWLREKTMGRDEIFQHFFPYIKAGQGDFYRNKMAGFFSAVDGLSRTDLNAVLRALQRADTSIKSSDVDAQTVLEIFLEEYCLLRGGRKSTSRG